MQLLRLTDEKKLGPDFNSRIIFNPVSKHTGTDLTLSWQHANPLIADDDNGQKPILVFARAWHARRAYQTALEQTPDFKPIMYLCPYGGHDPKNWQESPEYMAWMWSELKRLSNPDKKGMIQAIDGFSDEALVKMHDGLEAHLNNNGVRPEKIARGAPGSNGITITEPSSYLLYYPARVEKMPHLRQRLNHLMR